jgi:MerR family redox-sensitive transcriptional activator SoxR
VLAAADALEDRVDPSAGFAAGGEGVVRTAGGRDPRNEHVVGQLAKQLEAVEIGCGCLSLDRCRLGNPGDRVAARGPGPPSWIGDSRSAG